MGPGGGLRRRYTWNRVVGDGFGGGSISIGIDSNRSFNSLSGLVLNSACSPLISLEELRRGDCFVYGRLFGLSRWRSNKPNIVTCSPI